MLCAPEDLLTTLDPAQRLALRDAAVRHGLRLASGDAPRFPTLIRVRRANGTDIFARQRPNVPTQSKHQEVTGTRRADFEALSLGVGPNTSLQREGESV